jgi:REP element-mobilizing transposase RayT
MSSHIHWIFRPLADWISSEVGDNRSARESICHSIKRHTALACNRILEIRGSFWQDESYDHWVRDFDELIRCIEYVENNPVKAGLVARPEDWSYSSARDRMVNSIKMGEPLRP